MGLDAVEQPQELGVLFLRQAAAGGRLQPGPHLLDGTASHAALLRQVHQNHSAVVRRLLPGDHASLLQPLEHLGYGGMVDAQGVDQFLLGTALALGQLQQQQFLSG